MSKCPVCDCEVNKTANYCPECGNRMAAAIDQNWTVSMQERIKEARQNNLSFNICAAVGALIAVLIPFVMRFILLYTMETLSWVLTGVGIALFLAGSIGIFYSDHKVKKLIEELKRGEPQAES